VWLGYPTVSNERERPLCQYPTVFGRRIKNFCLCMIRANCYQDGVSLESPGANMMLEAEAHGFMGCTMDPALV
jgi:hypothetical protein